MSTVFYTALNATVLGIMRKTQRMDFLSDVMAYDFGTHKINFTRNTFMNASFEKLEDKNIYLEEDFEKDPIFQLKLDIQQVQLILEKAKCDALTSIKKLGVIGLKSSDVSTSVYFSRKQHPRTSF